MLEGAHIVEAVRQLDHDYADILRHRHEHLAQVLRLHLKLCFCLIAGIVRKMQMLQLGHAVHQKGNVRSELFSDLFDRHHGIFHHIVQKSRHDRLLIQLQIRQDNRHAQRMDDVRLAGFTHLSLMGVICQPIRFFNHGNIIRRMILAHPLDQVLI